MVETILNPDLLTFEEQLNQISNEPEPKIIKIITPEKEPEPPQETKPKELKSNSVLHHPDNEEYNPGTMPLKIKQNFIYRAVWNAVWQDDSNATFIFIGRPGVGKSVNALKMCYDMDPTFSLERVCYNIHDFLKLLSKGDSNGELHPGNCILFDEVVTDKGADSRSFMSKTNKLMNYITATFRARRLVVIYCLPSLTQLDKNIRDINVTGVCEVITKDTKKRKNLVKFQWGSYDARTQKTFAMFPRLISKEGQILKVTGVWIGIPPKEIIKEYNKKKMEYLKKNIDRWYAAALKEVMKEEHVAFNDKQVMQEVTKTKNKFFLSGKYSAYLVKEYFGISLSRANAICAYLNKQATGKLPQEDL